MASELYSTSARNRSSLSRSAASAGWRSVRSTIVGAVRFAGFFGERAIGSMLGVPGGFARKSRARLGGRRQPAGSLQTARAQSGCGGGGPPGGGGTPAPRPGGREKKTPETYQPPQLLSPLFLLKKKKKNK